MLHANVFVAQYQHHLALNHHRNQRHDLHHIFFSHPRRPALWAQLHHQHQQPQIKPQIYSYSDPHPILIRKTLSASRVHLLLGSSITHTLWWLTQFSSARLPFCRCLCHHQTFNFPLISLLEVAPCFDLIDWSWQAECIERGGSDWCPAPQRIFGWKLIQRKGTSVRKARSHNQIEALSAWDVSTVHNLVAIMDAIGPMLPMLVVHIQEMLNWQLTNSYVWSNLKNDVSPSFTKSDPHSHPPITLHHSQVLDTNGRPFVPRRQQMVDPRERLVVKWSVSETPGDKSESGQCY